MHVRHAARGDGPPPAVFYRGSDTTQRTTRRCAELLASWRRRWRPRACRPGAGILMSSSSTVAVALQRMLLWSRGLDHTLPPPGPAPASRRTCLAGPSERISAGREAGELGGPRRHGSQEKIIKDAAGRTGARGRHRAGARRRRTCLGSRFSVHHGQATWRSTHASLSHLVLLGLLGFFA